jgi:hypothetical protein
VPIRLLYLTIAQVGYAEDGLVHVPAGMGAVRVHAIHARALAALGSEQRLRLL